MGIFRTENESKNHTKLENFAYELDRRLKKNIICIINGPDSSLFDINSELARLEMRLPDPKMALIVTQKGIIHSFSGSYSSKQSYIKLASTSQITTYYKNLATLTLQEKKGNCIALAATCLLLSGELLKKTVYQDIEIQICQLANWKHCLIRLSSTQSSEVFFYDPWFQYWHSGNQNTKPEIFPALNYVSRIEKLISLHSMINKNPISRIGLITHYNSFTNQVNSRPAKTNISIDYGYYVICSSRSFSNPAKIISDFTISAEASSRCFVM